MNELSPEAIAASRSRAYWLLSDLYLARPDAQCLERLRVAVGEPQPPAGAAHEVFDDLLGALRAADEQRLLVEHARLFGGLRDGYGLPPPYESVHRESRLLGDCALAVVRAYADGGYGVIHADAGPQDHIGVELRFMSLCAHDEMQAWSRGETDAALAALSRQGAFLAQHLRAWVPGYCRRLAAQAREPFYAALARLTRRVVIDDDALVGSMLADAVA